MMFIICPGTQATLLLSVSALQGNHHKKTIFRIINGLQRLLLCKLQFRDKNSNHWSLHLHQRPGHQLNEDETDKVSKESDDSDSPDEVPPSKRYKKIIATRSSVKLPGNVP